MKKTGTGKTSFWIQNYKVSFLLLFLIIIVGLISLIQIPKESSPDIKFWIISISTLYSWVNPEDIDSLITEKIENEIEDIEGISSLTSTSSVGLSSVVVELQNGISTRDTMTDIKDRLDTISFPSDAEEPLVRELSTRNTLLFEALLYSTKPIDTVELMRYGRKIQASLEGKNGLASIDIGSSWWGWWLDQSATDSDGYDIQVLLDKAKMELLDISVPQVASTIQAYNKNTPLWNYAIGDLDYDFRFEGEFDTIEDLKNTVVSGAGSSLVMLRDIATFQQKYDSDSISRLWFYEASDYPYITLSFNKEAGSNIFSVSKEAKQDLEDLIQRTPEFAHLWVKYSQDLSNVIIEDYKNLGSTAIQTMVLVFLTIFLFIGIRESLIASILLPVAFLITFTVLNLLGLSLNFLTNFSLVLTLGIAIDTIIVIIEGASERQKIGYSRENAVMFAVDDLRSPLTSGTMTTLVAFLPMMFLPGVMWKFLSYIPITVFTTLAAALFLSLTIALPLFAKLAQKKKYYIPESQYTQTLTPEEKDFLQSEREGKQELTDATMSWRERLLEKVSHTYATYLGKFLESRKSRILSIILPFIWLILTFVFLSPMIGFTLFPASDEGVITLNIEWPVGSSESYLEPYLPQIESVMSWYPEVEVYNVTLSGNKINVYVELSDAKQRQKQWQADVFEIEEDMISQFAPLASNGLLVEAQTLENGPPSGAAVGVKLHAQNARDIAALSVVSQDFKNFLQWLDGTKNVKTTSTENPGQFVFRFNNAALSYDGLTPDDIVGAVRATISGMPAGSMTSTYEDNDIVIEMGDFTQSVTPQDIENLIIPTSAWNVRVGNYASYSFEPGLSSIQRDDTKVTIGVESDVEKWYLPTDIQPELIAFADTYSYPSGVSYSAGGENEENAELIQSTMQSFFIALFLIFTILVFQFNSYSQPLMILYSVILALLWVNIGLFLTGNPYSMTFAIGFIALTWVVVNDAIILVDRVNRNIKRSQAHYNSEILSEPQFEEAIQSGAEARLQPIIVTTLTTVFWVLPLALQDAFWAGLGFTMIFGLIAGSSMTLFVIPALYYTLYRKKITWDSDTTHKKTLKEKLMSFKKKPAKK